MPHQQVRNHIERNDVKERNNKRKKELLQTCSIHKWYTAICFYFLPNTCCMSVCVYIKQNKEEMKELAENKKRMR